MLKKSVLLASLTLATPVLAQESLPVPLAAQWESYAKQLEQDLIVKGRKLATCDATYQALQAEIAKLQKELAAAKGTK